MIRKSLRAYNTRCLNGLNTLISVLEERKAAGIEDVIGRDATPVDPNRDRLAKGTKTQTEIAGRPIGGKLYDFAPFANTLLREHLFNDLFERDLLTYQEREFATVGALAGIGNVNPQLAGHKAFATISMFNTGRVRRNGYIDSQLDSVQERMAQAAAARAAEIADGTVSYAGNVDFDALTNESIAKLSTDLYREGMVYYGRTHRHPNSTFRYTTSSLMELMSWDATDNIELINTPLLLIAGEKADSLYMSEEAFAKATGTNDKELFTIPGATHIQTYYVPEYVGQAVNKLQSFYARTL